MDEDELNAVVDEAVEGVRREWVATLRILAHQCDTLAPTVQEHDEALASSMEFVALRARRVADRSDEQHGARP
jgi:hypothetical protein